MPDRLERARIQAHTAYKTVLDGVLAMRGFTSITLAEIKRTGNYPSLCGESEDALNAPPLPKRLAAIISGLYPPAPVFAARMILTHDVAFIRMGSDASPSPAHDELIITGEAGQPGLQVDPWVLIYPNKGVVSSFKYPHRVNFSETARQANEPLPSRDEYTLKAAELRELAQLPTCVAKSQVHYASSQHLAVIDSIGWS